jgi:hypothetical protein
MKSQLWRAMVLIGYILGFGFVVWAVVSDILANIIGG